MSPCLFSQPIELQIERLIPRLGATLPPGQTLPPGATLPGGGTLPPGATLPPGQTLPPGKSKTSKYNILSKHLSNLISFLLLLQALLLIYASVKHMN